MGPPKTAAELYKKSFSLMRFVVKLIILINLFNAKNRDPIWRTYCDLSAILQKRVKINKLLCLYGALIKEGAQSVEEEKENELSFL